MIEWALGLISKAIDCTLYVVSTASDVNTIAAWAQVASFLASVVGFYIVWCQLKASRKTQDLEAVQRFFQHTIEQERSLKTARDAGELSWAQNEYFNFLEIYTSSLRRKLFGSLSHQIVTNKLIDTLVIIQGSTWEELLKKTKTFDKTYSGIEWFMKKHKGAINERRKKLPHD